VIQADASIGVTAAPLRDTDRDLAGVNCAGAALDSTEVSVSGNERDTKVPAPTRDSK
jgi:hypothetical protein